MFQARYVETVVARIFYGKRNFWDGRLTMAQFRTSGLLPILFQIEEEEEMNAVGRGRWVLCGRALVTSPVTHRTDTCQTSPPPPAAPKHT